MYVIKAALSNIIEKGNTQYVIYSVNHSHLYCCRAEALEHNGLLFIVSVLSVFLDEVALKRDNLKGVFFFRTALTLILKKNKNR